MILNGTGAYNTNSKETVNNELNKNLRQLSTNICCLKDSLLTKDYETNIAYNPLTNELVIVSFMYDAAGVLTVVNTNVDGTPYTGPAPVRGPKDYELSTKEWFCVNNTTTVSRVDIFVDGVFTSSFWQSLAGVVIAAPTAGTYTPGACVAKTQSVPLRDITYNNEVDFFVANPGGAQQDLLNESNKVIIDLVNNVSVGPLYTQTVRIVSDVQDIVRTEVINITSEVTPICYTSVSVGGGVKRQGFLITEKNHLGHIMDSWITGTVGFAVGMGYGAIDRINQAISDAIIVNCSDSFSNFNRTIIDCAIELTLGGSGYYYTFIKNGHLVEDTAYGALPNISDGKYFTYSDGITGSPYPVFIIDCPKLVCVEQNGIFFKAYKATWGSNVQYANQYAGSPTSGTEYFTEEYIWIDGSVDPITEIPCIDGLYNTVEHALIISSVTYAPNTIHIFSITAISGNVQLTLGATTPIGIPNGTSITLPATTLISNQIQVNVTGGSGSSAYVTLIKP